MYSSLISATQLHEQQTPAWVLVDCRFSLADTAAGRAAYESAHIPGAIYAHLDDDLSSAVPLTDNGRHPLPSAEQMRETFGRFGITPTTQVVVYDNLGGAIASRLWWMLRYMAHEAVAVLDGGIDHWLAAGLLTEAGTNENKTAVFTGVPHEQMLVTLDDLMADDVPLLIDSRSPGRYRGESEPIDPVAGHIPGAVNYFHANNRDENKLHRPAAQIRAQIDAVLGDVTADNATFHCGSGVTACANILATQYIGLPMPRLYVGSWSEWCRDTDLPVAQA